MALFGSDRRGTEVGQPVNGDSMDAKVVGDRPSSSRDRLGEYWLLVLVLVLPLLALTMIGRAEHSSSEELLEYVNARSYLWPAFELRDRAAYAIVLLLAGVSLAWALITSRSRAGRFSASVPSGRWWRTLPAVGTTIGMAAALQVLDQRLPDGFFSGFSRFDVLVLVVLALVILAPQEYPSLVEQYRCLQSSPYFGGACLWSRGPGRHSILITPGSFSTNS